MEKANPVHAAHFAQKTRHGNEVVIMYPDRIVGPQELLQLAGEFLIDAKIRCGIAFREISKIEAVMADRPKRPIGEATIVLMDVTP